MDTFFAADTVDGVQANISVTCEENASGVSTEQFVQSRLQTLEALTAMDLKTIGAVTVSGLQAQMVSYTLLRGQTSIRKTDVMVVTPRCAWTLASAAAPSTETQVRAVLDNFIRSFLLTASAPTS